MGKRATRILDDILDGLNHHLVGLGLRTPNSDSVYDFYAFLLVVSLLLSSYPLLCFLVFASNPHIVHWVGPEPKYVCALVPVLLMLLMLLMPLLKQGGFTRRGARLLVLVSFITAGVAMIASAVHLDTVSSGVAESLVYRCGSTGGASHEVEQEWQHLNAIRRQCVAAAGSEAVDMRHCPGFAQHQGSEHAAYLQQLEDDFRCTGFCRFWAPPLFVAGRAEAGKRCASALGAEVQRVGHLIAWPVVASGAVVIFLGAVLGAYEHL